MFNCTGKKRTKPARKAAQPQVAAQAQNVVNAPAAEPPVTRDVKKEIVDVPALVEHVVVAQEPEKQDPLALVNAEINGIVAETNASSLMPSNNMVSFTSFGAPGNAPADDGQSDTYLNWGKHIWDWDPNAPRIAETTPNIDLDLNKFGTEVPISPQFNFTSLESQMGGMDVAAADAVKGGLQKPPELVIPELDTQGGGGPGLAVAPQAGAFGLPKLQMPGAQMDFQNFDMMNPNMMMQYQQRH